MQLDTNAARNLLEILGDTSCLESRPLEHLNGLAVLESLCRIAVQNVKHLADEEVGVTIRSEVLVHTRTKDVVDRDGVIRIERVLDVGKSDVDQNVGQHPGHAHTSEKLPAPWRSPLLFRLLLCQLLISSPTRRTQSA